MGYNNFIQCCTQPSSKAEQETIINRYDWNKECDLKIKTQLNNWDETKMCISSQIWCNHFV